MTYERVLADDELWDGELRGVVVHGKKVVLLRHDGVVRAFADRCAHLGTPLSTGRLCDGVLTCSLHEWQYDVTTGAGVNPRPARLIRYDVRIEAGDIWVEVDGHD
jgi:toluene monooxygenase system ferredoxin subunit